MICVYELLVNRRNKSQINFWSKATVDFTTGRYVIIPLLTLYIHKGNNFKEKPVLTFRAYQSVIFYTIASLSILYMSRIAK